MMHINRKEVLRGVPTMGRLPSPIDLPSIRSQPPPALFGTVRFSGLPVLAILGPGLLTEEPLDLPDPARVVAVAGHVAPDGGERSLPAASG